MVQTQTPPKSAPDAQALWRKYQLLAAHCKMARNQIRPLAEALPLATEEETAARRLNLRTAYDALVLAEKNLMAIASLLAQHHLEK